MTNDKVVIIGINPAYQRVWGALPKIEYEALKQSIQIDGLLEKLKVNPNNVLLDGHNRKEALSDLGLPVTEDMVEVIEPENEMLYIIRSQINRRHATPYHRVENAIPLLEIERELARQRMLAGVRDPGRISTQGSRNPRTTDNIGALVGLHRSTVEQALYIEEYGSEEDKGALRRGTTTINKIWSKLTKGAHVGHATGEFEWYTPKEIIEAARKLMKTIDVDPASSDIANQIVKATTYYTVEDDGLKQEWRGNVWMNPPYSQPLVTQFCNLLVEKYVMGEINQACVLVNNATETEFYQNMMKHCEAICFIKGRVKFIDQEGKSTGAPLQGQTILYFGDNVTDFSFIFSEFGGVLHAKH